MTSQQQSVKKDADAIFQQHNFRKAIELYTNAINVDPSSELAGALFSNRSLCHHKLGNFAEALNDGIATTTLKPKWSRGFLRVATAYESLGKEDEAIEAYQKSLDLEENEEARKKYIALFRKNVDNMKKSQEELKLIGNGYVQKNKYDEAVIIYNASIDLDPSIESAAPIYSNRSLCFFNLGRFQEAEDDGCMAIFLRPEFARGYLRRGNAAMKLEKWKEASEAFEKYFELDPETAKDDPDLVKNKNSVKKLWEQKEGEQRKHDQMIEKTRAEIMAIKDEDTRMMKMAILMGQQLTEERSFDVDVVRMLVECGATLVPVKSSPGSLLISLLGQRREVSPKVLSQLDELIFFVIEEMLRRDDPFVGCELFFVSTRRVVGSLNPKLLRVLLETNKFDVNESFGMGRPAPLISLVFGLIESVEVPPEASDCLHLLLKWKGINVNAISQLQTCAGCEVAMTALGFARHLEVAKLLIRHGANVNAVTSLGGAPANVLDHILNMPHNPDQEELVRLLIQSGARLLPSGRDKKSSSTIMLVLGGASSRPSRTKYFVSEEVLQMILQLNQVQGLLFKWQDPTVNSLIEIPFFLMSISTGAPFRFVELLCAMTPEPMKETGRCVDGEAMTVVSTLIYRIRNKESSFEESMQVLGLLLERGLNLSEPVSKDDAVITFAALWNECREVKQHVNLLKKIVVEKRGEQEFQRCMNSLK